MAKNNVILVVKNIFIKKNAKKINGISWPKATISIPMLKVRRDEKLALYISKDNKNLNFRNIAQYVIGDKLSSMTYFNKVNENEYYDYSNFLTNKKEVIAKTSYFNVSEIVNENDINLPLFEIWNDCFKIAKKLVEDKEFINKFKVHEYSLKNIIYTIVRNNTSELITLTEEFVKKFKITTARIKALYGDATLKDDETNLINDLKNTINEFKNQTLKPYLSLFREFKTYFNQLNDNFQQNHLNNQTRLIEESKIKLNYMNQINTSSILKVENDLKIRDLNFEIEYYRNYKNSILKISKKMMNNFILLIKKEIQTLELKKKLIDYVNDDYFDIIKDIFLKELELKIWNKNYNSLLYLNVNELINLKNSISSEINLFISNNFTQNIKKYKNKNISEIKEFISREFVFDIKTYTIKSKMASEKINEEILKCKEQIRNIKYRPFNHISSYKNIVAVHEFEEQIKLATAELEWARYSEQKLFSTYLKNKEFRLSRFITKIKNCISELQDEIAKTQRFYVAKSYSLTSVLPAGLDETLNDLSFFLKNNWMNNALFELINYSSSKTSPSNKFLIQCASIIKFAEIFETISVTPDNYLIKFSQLETIDKAKLKLTKYRLKNDSVLFVEDDTSNDFSKETRNEFLRVLFKFSDTQKIPIVFITSDLDVIKRQFDRVYIFDDTQLLEGGKVKQVFENPINPTLKALLNQRIDTINFQKNLDFTQFFIKEGIYYKGNGNSHFVYSTLQEFQKWTLNNSNVDFFFDKNANTAEKAALTATQTTIVSSDDYFSVFDDEEIVLTDQQHKAILEPEDKKDHELFWAVKELEENHTEHNIDKTLLDKLL
ncbi:hypothetical protein H9M94_03235 [Mycoplasma sp. Pen4]|uniref:MAG1360 family OppF-related protein n=1 Tax=Mycoplasma sp. Pen4 TaxID=640330 RepID=UPI001654B918|nr:hypothetical protein [Mycoplasma sp. Pen4]QNM93592.1 hypothetical protein H9M94_03235 [Mycoplasma sp. Pen4]